MFRRSFLKALAATVAAIASPLKLFGLSAKRIVRNQEIEKIAEGIWLPTIELEGSKYAVYRQLIDLDGESKRVRNEIRVSLKPQMNDETGSMEMVPVKEVVEASSFAPIVPMQNICHKIHVVPVDADLVDDLNSTRCVRPTKILVSSKKNWTIDSRIYDCPVITDSFVRSNVNSLITMTQGPDGRPNVPLIYVEGGYNQAEYSKTFPEGSDIKEIQRSAHDARQTDLKNSGYFDIPEATEEDVERLAKALEPKRLYKDQKSAWSAWAKENPLTVSDSPAQKPI